MPTHYLKDVKYTGSGHVKGSVTESANHQPKQCVQSIVQCYHMLKKIIACFQAMCGERNITSMTNIAHSLNSKDAHYVDKHSDWSAAI